MKRSCALLLLVCLASPASLRASESAISGEDEQATPSSEIPRSTTATPVPFDKKWLMPYFATGPASRASAQFRSGDFTTASREIDKLVASLPTHAPERNPLRFLAALALMNQSSWQDAGDLFEDLWSTYPLLAPYHATYAARCRLRGGDTAKAFAWLARIPSGTVPEAEATMFKVDAFLADKRWAEAEAEISAYLNRFPKGPRRAEALFQRAEALQALGRPIEDVAAAYRKVWSEAPLETWATRANDRLEALAKSAPSGLAASLNQHSADDLVTRGLIFFDGNQNTQAEATLAAALALPGLSKSLRCKVRYHLAQSVWKQRQRPRAAPLFDQAIADCRDAGEQDLLVRALYQGGRSYASAGDKEKALRLYAQIEKDTPEHRYADDARLRAAEVLLDNSKTEEAENMLSDLADLYPKGDMAPESLWRLALDSWRAHDYKKTLHWLDETLRRYPREDIFYAEGRALYWKARSLEKTGEHKKAREVYERTVREYPLSVYTFFALERLRRSFPAAREAILHELRAHMGEADRKSPWHFGPQAIFGEPGFLRAVEFARMGLGSEARRELAKLGLGLASAKSDPPAASGREDVFWITAILLDRSGQWNASHAIPRYTTPSFRRSYPSDPRREAEWRLAYPKAFPDLVVKNGRVNHVPDALQWSIMREESTFYPRAESFANALGLTQMMPKTAQRFAPWPVTREALLDPGKNLEVGSRFLAFLLEHFSGAVPLTISGYNAGEAGVDRWLRERGDVELDEFIETIPFEETRGYTKRVLSTYLTYAWLYDPERPIPHLDFTLPKPDTKKPAATAKKKSSAASSMNPKQGKRGK